MQRPHIVRVLGGALHRAAQAEIVAIALLGFFTMALVEKQGGQRMARRGHPRPMLGLGQIVVKLDRLPQVGVGLFMLAW
jgi:hypothetical protein